MNKFDIDLRKEWEQLPTPDLETMLQAELEKTPPDDDTVLLILHILEAREPDESTELTEHEKAAFERYKQRVSRRQKKPAVIPRWLSIAACAVLILGLLFTTVPQKAQAETFWEMLQRWSDTVLGYLGREDKFGTLEYTFETDNAGLQQVYDAVVELGVTEPVVPMWLPEECDLIEIDAWNTPATKGIYAVFSAGDGEIIYQINVFAGEPAHQYYKDDSHYESYELEGTTYNITRNNERWSVIWTKSNIECHITLDCQEDTLRRILKSIYVMEE
jgi:hypothetical protein